MHVHTSFTPPAQRYPQPASTAIGFTNAKLETTVSVSSELPQRGPSAALHSIPLFRAVSPPNVGLSTTPRRVAGCNCHFPPLSKNSPPLAPIVPACHSDPATSSERSEGSGNRRLIECK